MFLGLNPELVERHPWVPLNLQIAFDKAKAIAMKRIENPRRMPIHTVVIDPDSGFLKIIIITLVNIYEFLWVPVGYGEPTALHLYHQLMSFFKSMGNIG